MHIYAHTYTEHTYIYNTYSHTVHTHLPAYTAHTWSHSLTHSYTHTLSHVHKSTDRQLTDLTTRTSVWEGARTLQKYYFIDYNFPSHMQEIT